jgi:hypothetical protein
MIQIKFLKKKRSEGLIKEEEKEAKVNIANNKNEDIDLNDRYYKAFLFKFFTLLL